MKWRILRALIAAMVCVPTPSSASCGLEVKIYFDISGSTDPKRYVQDFLNLLAGLPDKPNVEIVPFGHEVYPICRRQSPLDWAPGTFPPQCELSQIRAVLDAPGDQQFLPKTDLLDLTDKLRERVEEPVPVGTRRVIVVFSDFVQSTGTTPLISFYEWVNRNEERLGRLASALSTSASRLILVGQPPLPGNESRYTEVSDFRAFLKKEAFNLWEAELNIEGGFRDEVAEESTPLKLHVAGVAADRIRVELENPACRERTGIEYRIARTDGRESKIITPDSRADSCPSTLVPGPPVICSLPAEGLPSDQNCPQYELHARPAYHRAANKSEPFTGYPCFKVHAVSLDIAPDGGRSTLRAECLKEEFSIEDLEQKDLDAAVRAAQDAGRTMLLEEGKPIGWVGFAACIEASGLLQGGVEKNFAFTEVRRGSATDPPVDILASGINLDRFGLVPTPPERRRFFPVFAWLRSEDARILCYNAHDEKPSRVRFSHSPTAPPSLPGTSPVPPEAPIILYRNRDRDAEETLHNSWESLLFPLGALLGLATLAIRSTRQSSSAALEEYLAILTLGVLAVAAVLHDVTNLGDDLEQKFSREPGFYTTGGLLALGLFFVYWVARGAFEPRRLVSVASIELGSKSLGWRKLWFWCRTGIWLLFVFVIIGWTGTRVKADPKRIEECHFEGRVLASGSGVEP